MTSITEKHLNVLKILNKHIESIITGSNDDRITAQSNFAEEITNYFENVTLKESFKSKVINKWKSLGFCKYTELISSKIDNIFKLR